MSNKLIMLRRDGQIFIYDKETIVYSIDDRSVHYYHPSGCLAFNEADTQPIFWQLTNYKVSSVMAGSVFLIPIELNR